MAVPPLRAWEIKYNLVGLLPVDQQYAYSIVPHICAEQFFNKRFSLEEGVGRICQFSGSEGQTGVPLIYTRHNHLNSVKGIHLDGTLFFQAVEKPFNKCYLSFAFGAGASYDYMHGSVDQEERLLFILAFNKVKDVQFYKEQGTIQFMLRLQTRWKSGLLMQYEIGPGYRWITNWENSTQLSSMASKPVIKVGVKIGFYKENMDTLPDVQQP